MGISLSIVSKSSALMTRLVFKFVEEGERALSYVLIWESGDKEFSFESKNFVLCRQPENELKELSRGILDFLDDKRKYIFVPAEGNFHLRLEKIRDEDIALYLWLDIGDWLESTESSWDGIGLRMCCTREALANFANECQTLARRIP